MRTGGSLDTPCGARGAIRQEARGTAILREAEQVSSGRSGAESTADVLPIEHWQERFDADADTLDERSLDALPPRLRVHGHV